MAITLSLMAVKITLEIYFGTIDMNYLSLKKQQKFSFSYQIFNEHMMCLHILHYYKSLIWNFEKRYATWKDQFVCKMKTIKPVSFEMKKEKIKTIRII